MTEDGSSGGVELDRLADEFLALRRAGETVTIESFAAAHPDLRAEIEDLFPMLVRMEDAAGRAPAPAPRSVGPYRVLRELGRGGMGVVYLAQDERLDRRVALKVLTPSLGASANLVIRFRREAEIASRLDHPGICTVYEAGESDGVAFIAMRFVEGETLSQRIAAARESGSRLGRDATERMLAIVEKTARALHVAHEAGLIHRDVKPGNVMVTPSGEPVVLDFGLARGAAHDESATLTQTGAMLGTPAYMSPEQILATRYRLDRRTDVYSLGVTLYEALTLKLPFEAPTHGQLYQEILSTQPESLRRLNPAVGDDLRIVVETAMDRDRERRYATAADFAEDLCRVRGREPIRARPAGRMLRLRRWAQRNPVLATSTAGLFVTLAVGLAISLHLLGETRRERDAKDAALEKLQSETRAKTAALDANRRALRRARSVALAHASSLVAAEKPADPMLALLLAREAVRAHDTPEALTSLHEAIFASLDRASWVAHDDGVTAVAWSPTGDFVVSGGSDRTARVWDLTGHRLGEMHCAERGPGVTAIAVSRDGASIATAAGGETRLWTRGGRPIATLAGELGAVASGADRLVVYAEQDVRVHDWQGRLIASLEGHTAEVRAAAITPDGRTVATVAQDRTLRLWSVPDGPCRVIEIATRGGPPGAKNDFGQVGRVVLSPDGRYAATWSALHAGELAPPGGSDARVLDVFEPGAGGPGGTRRSVALPSDIGPPVFTSHGLFVASKSAGLYRWQAGGDPDLTRCTDGWGELVAAPDASRLAVCGAGIRVLDAQGAPRRVLNHDVRIARSGELAFSPDGWRIVVGDGALLRIADVDPSELPTLDLPFGERCDNPRFLGHGEKILAWGNTAGGPASYAFDRSHGGGRARVLDLDGRLVGMLGAPDVDVRWAEPSPDGRLVVTAFDGGAAIWTIDAQLVRRIDVPPGGALFLPQFSRRGDRIAALRSDADGSKAVVVWDVEGREVAKFDVGAATLCVTFAGKSDRLVTTERRESATDWIRLQEVGPIQARTVDGGWFSPWDVEAWTNSSDTTCVLWDLDGRRVASLVPPAPVEAMPGTLSVIVWDEAGRQSAVVRIGGPATWATYRLHAGGVALTDSGRSLGLEDADGRRVCDVLRSIEDDNGYFLATINGTRIATHGSHGVMQFALGVGDLLHVADQRVLREFTPKERERFDLLLASPAESR